jgi:hypothetical protein
VANSFARQAQLKENAPSVDGWLLYSQIGVPVSLVAEAILSGVALAEACQTISTGQEPAPTTWTAGGWPKFTRLQIAWAVVDLLGAGASYPVGDDLEADTQFTNWVIHLLGAVSLPWLKKFLPGPANAILDMSFGLVEWALNLAAFIIEMVESRTSEKAREDRRQNIEKMVSNHVHWVSRGTSDATAFDEEPETKAVFAAVSGVALIVSLGIQVARVVDGIQQKRELQRF